MAKKYIYVKMTKEWGGFGVGDVVRFGYNKGESRIREGYGIEVPKQKAVNDPVKEKPKVETATKPVKVEKAEVAPKITAKPEPAKTVDKKKA